MVRRAERKGQIRKTNNMKKLMIAAAAAAMVGGAYAAYPTMRDNIEANNIGSMYNVAISLKTMVPKTYDSTKTKGCVICPTTEGETCHLFEQGTLKINGIFASCDCEDTFKYGYYWVGSGKKAVAVLPPVTNAVEYTDLPEDVMKFGAYRFSKTNKKVAAYLGLDGDAFELLGYGFGTYTDAKYSYNKANDVFTLKTPAKVSVSGSITGLIDTQFMAEINGEESNEYVAFEMDGVCTVGGVACSDGDYLNQVPAVGTFSVKPRSIAKLSKVIPAPCYVTVAP